MNNGAALKTWPIVLLRVYTGVFFLYYGFRKVSREGGFGIDGFLGAQENTYGWYQAIVESVVLPAQGLFAFLVAWGELFMGIALIVGFATRYAALAGAFMVANFWFAKGQGFLDAQNHDAIWLVILLVLGLMNSGQVMGVDARLSQRFAFLR